MLEQTTNYLNKYDIINDSHIGGISGMSTIDAIEQIHNKLKLSRQQNTPSVLICLDQTGAFSMIDHFIMIKN